MCGLGLDGTVLAYVAHTSAHNNLIFGISLSNTTTTYYITHITAAYNYNGVYITNALGTVLKSTVIEHSGKVGISLSDCNSTFIDNTTVTNSCFHGVYLFHGQRRIIAPRAPPLSGQRRIIAPSKPLRHFTLLNLPTVSSERYSCSHGFAARTRLTVGPRVSARAYARAAGRVRERGRV